MICPNCGYESADGSAFCGECGYDFSSDNIMNALEEAPVQEAPKKKLKTAAGKPAKPSAKTDKPAASGEERAKMLKKLRISLISVAVAVIAIAIGILILSRSQTEGEKMFKNVPIGRDLAYAESKTGREFTLVSKYSALGSVAEFSGICESENGIKVEGTHFPEWAITVSLAADNTINRASYYDFSQLQKTWKGHYSSAEISSDNIEYGMNEKTVRRKMGFEPYCVIKSIDNSAYFIYRYYYPDPVTDNDRVLNYVVVFNDADGTVKDVYVQELNYCAAMLAVK